MALNPEIAEVTYRQSVVRKIPTMNKVILWLMYIAVFIFTILGSMWGALMLVPSLGTLFFAWYYKGVISVTYDYQLDGYNLEIRRLSGTRSKPVNVLFAHIDLKKLIVIADQFSEHLAEADALFEAQPKARRVTYYTSAQDPDRPAIVLYAHGMGEEEGFIVRVYVQPSSQLLHCLKKLCPGKVFADADLI